MNDPAVQLDPGEQIILIAHRHFINFFPILVMVGLVLIASVAIPAWLSVHPDLFGNLFPVPVMAISSVLLVLDLLAGVVAIIAFLIFRQSRIILTNVHMIQITQAGLFGRTLSKLTLDELQDVKGSRKGVLATIFNYGDILIESAGAQENFLFRPIGNPLSVAETINDAHEAFERAHTFERP